MIHDVTRAESLAAAILKRAEKEFRFREGRDETLCHRGMTASLPIEVHLEACRLVEAELGQRMRAAGYEGRLYVNYGEGCRASYLGWGIRVRVVAEKNMKPRGWGRPRPINRNIPLARFSQD